MRKIFVFISAGALLLLSSCNSNSGGMSDKAKKNLAAAQAVAKMFESGDYSKVGDYIANDCIEHSDMGDIKGLDSIKAEFAKYSKTMSEMKNEVVKELADDDYVSQWLNESGKMNVDEMSLKAGQAYTFAAIEVSKFNADGKVTEHWTFMNPADIMKMMAPPQGNMGTDMGAKMDSTKPK